MVENYQCNRHAVHYEHMAWWMNCILQTRIWLQLSTEHVSGGASEGSYTTYSKPHSIHEQSVHESV